jgi:dihydrofolate reductase
MPHLIYFTITSLDGYTSDTSGGFDWAAPDEEVHAFVNDLERPIGTYLYGRRMYETMTYWETAPTGDEASPVERDFATIWRAADKIVYSTTLETVSTARTRIEPRFDPAEVRQLKAASPTDLAIGGADLGAQVLTAGLVDEIQLLVVPVIVGGGHRGLPEGVRLDLELLEERRFGNGTVYLDYRVG